MAAGETNVILGHPLVSYEEGSVFPNSFGRLVQEVKGVASYDATDASASPHLHPPPPTAATTVNC